MQLKTNIDLEGLMDILEMHEVHTSWKNAEAWNNEWRSNLPK